MNTDEIKASVSKKAVDECIQSDMLVGIGTGSTIKFAIDYLSEKITKEELSGVRFVPTSTETHLLCIEKRIPLLSEWDVALSSRMIDITLDGADKVTSAGYLIKGLGGAALREKVIAYNSYKFVVLVDEGKLTDTLAGYVPLEVLPFAYRFVERKLIEMGTEPKRRRAPAGAGKDGLLLSDNGNFIVDAYVPFPIEDPEDWEKRLRAIPGLIDSGLFCHTNQSVYIGSNTGEIKKVDFESLKNF